MNARKGLWIVMLLGALSVGQANAMSSGGSSATSAATPEFEAGVAAVNAKDFAAAEAHLKASVAKLPNHADSWSMLGFASRKLGKTDEAFKYYRQALSIDDEHRPGLNYLGHLFLETGQMDKAKGILKRLSSACLFGCPEYDDLKAAIAAGKSGKY